MRFLEETIGTYWASRYANKGAKCWGSLVHKKGLYTFSRPFARGKWDQLGMRGHDMETNEIAWQEKVSSWHLCNEATTA